MVPLYFSGLSKNYCAINPNIQIKYIQPGKPQQNAFIERFNRLYREDVLDAYLFEDIQQAGDLSDQWKEDHNENHLHGSLGSISPRKYLRTGLTRNSNLRLGNMSKISTS